MVFDSYGLISRLPIPISVAACLIGIPLIGHYRNGKFAIIVCCSSFALMIISLLVVASGQGEILQEKIIKLSQFLLPMVALVLGQVYVCKDDELSFLSKSFFIVLFIIILLQMSCSWQYGFTMLSPYLFLPYIALFSIYQHLQYVPVVFASAFIIVLFVLGSDNALRKWIVIFMPIMVLYVVVSTTLTGMFLLISGTLIYVLMYINMRKWIIIKLACAVFLIFSLAFGYLYHYRGQNMLEEKISIVTTNELSGIEITGIKKRLWYWDFYGNEVIKDAKTFFFGNALPMSRAKHASAHNYYLDFVYNFGFLSFIPMLILIAATLRGAYRKRKDIFASPELMGITIVVLYLLFVENMLKVGMRQPYPGIFTFFLWGILISKLSVFSLREPGRNEAASASA
ncbi:MAG TPA: hypothetical protein PLR60_04580 [Syntrophorhabdaceae bacterium]|nr:hypothetical protein [Syntrophorhabdaceae bacterium]